jgi:hypothetical protein
LDESTLAVFGGSGEGVIVVWSSRSPGSVETDGQYVKGSVLGIGKSELAASRGRRFVTVLGGASLDSSFRGGSGCALDKSVAVANVRLGQSPVVIMGGSGGGAKVPWIDDSVGSVGPDSQRVSNEGSVLDIDKSKSPVTGGCELVIVLGGTSADSGVGPNVDRVLDKSIELTNVRFGGSALVNGGDSGAGENVARSDRMSGDVELLPNCRPVVGSAGRRASTGEGSVLGVGKEEPSSSGGFKFATVLADALDDSSFRPEFGRGVDESVGRANGTLGRAKLVMGGDPELADANKLWLPLEKSGFSVFGMSVFLGVRSCDESFALGAGSPGRGGGVVRSDDSAGSAGL